MPCRQANQLSRLGADLIDIDQVPSMNSEDENKSSMSDRDRLLVELEFVQNLSNPVYLHFLAQNKYLVDEAFLNYLQYLRYWKQPEYARLLKFPHCLTFLDALCDNATFRANLCFVQFRDFLHQQQAVHWMFESKDLFLEFSLLNHAI